MPPRPFPSSLRIGIDICSTRRIWSMLDSAVPSTTHPTKTTTKTVRAEKFLTKLFTPRELAYFNTRFLSPDPEVARSFSQLLSPTATSPFQPPQLEQFSSLPEDRKKHIGNFVAGRWAAKEACVKAVKPRKLTLREVEVWPDGEGGVLGVVVGEGTAVEGDVDAQGEGEGESGLEYEGVKGQVVRVSISHDERYACAVAVYADERVGIGGEEEVRGLREEVKGLRREIEELREMIARKI